MGPLVKTLASNVRGELLSDPEIGPLRTLRRDSILFQQDHGGTTGFLIESGLVKLIRTSENGSRLIISILSSEELVGCEALGEHEYLTDVTCLTDVTGYLIPLGTLKRILAVPELATALWHYASIRDLERVNRIEMLTRNDVEHRILYSLAQLARLVKPLAGGTSYPIPITQLEIAIFVGATRETTSTTLSNLQDRQLVMLSRRLVTTVHPDLLISAAAERRAKAVAADALKTQKATGRSAHAGNSS